MNAQRRIYSGAEESQAWHAGRERAESRTGDLRRELLTFLRLLLTVVSKFLQFAASTFQAIICSLPRADDSLLSPHVTRQRDKHANIATYNDASLFILLKREALITNGRISLESLSEEQQRRS